MKESFQKHRDFLMLAGWTAFAIAAAVSVSWNMAVWGMKAMAWPSLFHLLEGFLFGLGIDAFFSFKRRVWPRIKKRFGHAGAAK